MIRAETGVHFQRTAMAGYCLAGLTESMERKPEVIVGVAIRLDFDGHRRRTDPQSIGDRTRRGRIWPALDREVTSITLERRDAVALLAGAWYGQAVL
jgi:hypothetical protein